MEDHAIDIIIGKGPAARSIRIDLAPFTLIGATTRAGQLSTPLRDRFGVIFRLELYTPAELAQIVTRSAGILGFAIDEDGALEIASRSRGTPRIANRLLKRVRDFAQVMGRASIDEEVASYALGKLEIDELVRYSVLNEILDEFDSEEDIKDTIDDEVAAYALGKLEIDELGLDNTDRRMLEAIIDFYNGGPVGLDTLAATVGEEAITLEDVYEPYLIQIGFLARTPRGRIATKLAYEHLDKPYNEANLSHTEQLNIDHIQASTNR